MMDETEAMMDDMEAMMNEEEPNDDKVAEDDAQTEVPVGPPPKKTLGEIALEEEGCLCCCCICHCSTEETIKEKCCCCLPIKCGVVVIANITILLFTIIFLQVFFKLINESFDWWYVLVAVLLLVPFFIGVGFNIFWMAEDQNSTRARLWVSCAFTIISVILLGFWNCFYIVYLFKEKEIRTEVGEIVTKKQYVVWSLWLATCISFLWGYFICITHNYYIHMMSYDERMTYKKELAEKQGGFLGGVSLPGLPKEEEQMMAAMDVM